MHDSNQLNTLIASLRMAMYHETPPVLRYKTSREAIKDKNHPDILHISMDIPESIERIKSFKTKNKRLPKYLILNEKKVLIHGKSARDCEYLHENLVSGNISDNSVLKGNTGRVANKNIIITGAAMGFGKGIAEELIKEGANIVVADINEKAGKQTESQLNAHAKENEAIFVKTNIIEENDLSRLIDQTVLHFGGVDVFISNAGILKAGGIDEMAVHDFDQVTKINYNAYFYCVKQASRIMKAQHKIKPGYYSDIIQVNSKSGLQGSKKNFAYSGSKFGGIGLTQSFALELAPFKIKVNSICPGNYHEGPLWSDPENGLFVQYLKAGKVPGAKTVEDVKNHYIDQVPLKRGCNPGDVVKAVLYLIDQENETGQALPVSGGQVMLS